MNKYRRDIETEERVKDRRRSTGERGTVKETGEGKGEEGENKVKCLRREGNKCRCDFGTKGRKG